MLKLEPIDAQLSLKYECSGCQSSVWITGQEAQTKGFKWVCVICNKANAVKPIKKFYVRYKFYKTKSAKKYDSISNVELIACKVLRGQGFLRLEAREMIEQVKKSKDIFGQSVDWLVAEAIKTIKLR